MEIKVPLSLKVFLGICFGGVGVYGTFGPVILFYDSVVDTAVIWKMISLITVGVLIWLLALFILSVMWGVINQTIIATDSGVLFSRLRSKEYTGEIPWEHIKWVSVGRGLNRTRFIKVHLKDDVLITESIFPVFRKPKNHFIYNIRVFSESSQDIADKLNDVRLNRNTISAA